MSQNAPAKPGSAGRAGHRAQQAAARRLGGRLAPGQRPVAGVRADEHRRAVRLRPARRVAATSDALEAALRGRAWRPAARDAVQRRGLLVRPGGARADRAARIRAGGRRHGRRRARPPARHTGTSSPSTSAAPRPRPRRSATARCGSTRCTTSAGRRPSAGYPVQVPTVEIVEIGAGGGSVAWAGRGGRPARRAAQRGRRARARLLRPGRHRADADRREPAGRPARPRLLPRRHHGARQRRRGRGRSPRSAAGSARTRRTVARGVIRYAVAQMSHALRLVTLRRGYDPRDFVFVAYGGAGPLHAALLARELGISQDDHSAGPGHFSAFGMLASPLRGDAVRTVVGPLDETDLTAAFAGRARRRSPSWADAAGPAPVETAGTPSFATPGRSTRSRCACPDGSGPRPLAGMPRASTLRAALPGDLLVPARRSARGRLAPGQRDRATARRSAGPTATRRARRATGPRPAGRPGPLRRAPRSSVCSARASWPAGTERGRAVRDRGGRRYHAGPARPGRAPDEAGNLIDRGAAVQRHRPVHHGRAARRLRCDQRRDVRLAAAHLAEPDHLRGARLRRRASPTPRRARLRRATASPGSSARSATRSRRPSRAAWTCAPAT